MAETSSVVRQIVVEGNRSEGVVEALLRGSPADVEAMIAEMRQGPRLAAVDRLSVTGRDETHGDDSAAFVIRPTA